MSSGLAGEAFVLLGATGEVSASPPQVAMDSTSPIATQNASHRCSLHRRYSTNLLVEPCQ